MTLDLCIVDFIDEYRIPNIRATRLSQEVSGPLRSLILETDSCAQTHNLLVPELYIILNGYRLTYRNERRYFSIIFRNGTKNLELITDNLRTMNIPIHPYAIDEAMIEMSLYLKVNNENVKSR